MRIKMDRTIFALLVSFAVLALLPLGLGNNGYIMHLLIMCLIWSVVAVNWDLVLGYGGIFSFAQIAFFVIGAFTAALFGKNLGVSPWLGLFIGGGAACGIGMLISLPVMRLRGAYVALVTLGLHEILPPLIRAGRPIGTGGMGSLVGIPPFQVGSYIFSAMDRVPPYYIALVIFALTMLTVHKIIHSRFGLAFVALRDAEPFAKTLGVDDYRSKLILFGISAFFCGLIGAFYGSYLGLISSALLGMDLFILVLVMVIVGGLGRFPGAIIGAFIFTFLNEFLRPLEEFRPVILGGLAIAVMMGSPEGLMGIPKYFAGFKRFFRAKQEVT